MCRRRDERWEEEAGDSAVQLAHTVRLCSKRIERQVMRAWLHSMVNAILGKVPGKTGRLDTATRMAMGADLRPHREQSAPAPPRQRGRDDEHLVKPTEDAALFEQLVRIVNEAQERDAEDERRLYHPMRGARPSFSQRDRLDRGA
jgi:hypothetical protein